MNALPSGKCAKTGAFPEQGSVQPRASFIQRSVHPGASPLGGLSVPNLGALPQSGEACQPQAPPFIQKGACRTGVPSARGARRKTRLPNERSSRRQAPSGGKRANGAP